MNALKELKLVLTKVRRKELLPYQLGEAQQELFSSFTRLTTGSQPGWSELSVMK